MHEHINQILVEEDVEGLLELGAPLDEYEDEAEKLMHAIQNVPIGERTLDRITAECYLVWQECFSLSDEDMDLRQANLERTVVRIYSLL